MSSQAGGFSSWLKRAMDKQGMNQAELARGAGLSPGPISKWLRGAKPDLLSCVRLADYLRKPLVDALRAADFEDEVIEPIARLSKGEPRPVTEEDLYKSKHFISAHKALQDVLEGSPIEVMNVFELLSGVVSFLKEQSLRVEAILRAYPGSMFLVDLEGRIIDAHGEGLQPRELLLGKAVADVFPEEIARVVAYGMVEARSGAGDHLFRERIGDREILVTPADGELCLCVIPNG